MTILLTAIICLAIGFCVGVVWACYGQIKIDEMNRNQLRRKKNDQQRICEGPLFHKMLRAGERPTNATAGQQVSQQQGESNQSKTASGKGGQ